MEHLRQQNRGERVVCCYRMAACPLLVVVDENIVPCQCSHVEGVQRAEDPEKWNTDELNGQVGS